MTEFEIDDPAKVIKIGDTIVDIEEGKNAGVKTVGIIEGSSLMGLTEEEFVNMTKDEQTDARAYVEREFDSVDADYVINSLSELPEVIRSLNQLKEM